MVYELCGGETEVQVVLADGTIIDQSGDELDAELSAEIFSRTGRVRLVRVGVAADTIRKV